MTLLEEHARAILFRAREAAEDPALALRVADTLGAWIAGAATQEGRGFAEAGDPLPLLGNALPDEVARAVATIRLTEIDDIHMRSCVTCGSVVVPAALLLAERTGANGARLAQAIVAGYETMMRFGVAVNGPAILYRGLWPTYLAAPIGVAALASVLLELDETRAAHALSIALAQTSGAPGGPAPGRASRWLLAGWAARAGLDAAVAASHGYAGDPTLLDGDWLQRTHGLHFDPAPFHDREPILHETSVKPWCAAKQTTAALDAFRQLLAEGLDPTRIAHLRVETPTAYRAMISHKPPGRLGRIVNIGWQLAVAAYREDTMLEIERADYSGDARFMSLAEKVEVVADPMLDAFYPARWPAKVVATMNDGSVAERLVTDAVGDPEFPMDAAAVAEKFRRVTHGVLDEPTAQSLLETALRPTHTTDVAALAGAARAALAQSAR